MRRSELYQNLCSNRAARLAEARAEGKSVRAGIHSVADFTIELGEREELSDQMLSMIRIGHNKVIT
jgi:hypothetical protein